MVTSGGRKAAGNDGEEEEEEEERHVAKQGRKKNCIHKHIDGKYRIPINVEVNGM